MIYALIMHRSTSKFYEWSVSLLTSSRFSRSFWHSSTPALRHSDFQSLRVRHAPPRFRASVMCIGRASVNRACHHNACCPTVMAIRSVFVVASLRARDAKPTSRVHSARSVVARLHAQVELTHVAVLPPLLARCNDTAEQRSRDATATESGQD